MTPDQEDKCARFWASGAANNISLAVCKRVWKACLSANGIGSEPNNIAKCGHENNKPCDCELHKGESTRAEAIPDGYFKIGEKVQFKKAQEESYHNAEVRLVGMDQGSLGYLNDTSGYIVRRIPAWKPKDGEAVFWYNGSVVHVGRIDAVHGSEYDVTTYLDTYVATLEFLKPFDASKIGLPWSEL